MNDAGRGEQRPDHPAKALPGHRAPLAAPVQPLEQVVRGKVHIARHATAVAADAVVLDMSAQMAPDIGHHGLPTFGPQSPQASTELLELLADPLAFRLAPHHKAPCAAAPEVVGESEKAEGPGCVTVAGVITRGLAAEGQHRRLTGLHLQVELRQPLLHLRLP